MRIKVIYSDLSEWIGDTADYAKSPRTGTCEHCIGILTITLYYQRPYKLILAGHDYYAIRDLPDRVEIVAWSDYLDEGQGWIIEKETYRQKDWRFERKDYLTDMPTRPGKWVADEDMDTATARAFEWL